MCIVIVIAHILYHHIIKVHICFVDVKYKPPHGRNHSDMPPGDDDDYRNSERLNSTTNRFHFGKVKKTILICLRGNEYNKMTYIIVQQQ